VKDTLQTYTDVPVKAFFGKEPYSQAEQQFKTKAFSWEQIDDCIAFMKEKLGSTDETIKAAFDELDTNKNGVIEGQEIKDIASKLGMPMDEAEIKTCLQDLDQN
jgi:Ca2+-binding EF-hand superfamily protein